MTSAETIDVAVAVVINAFDQVLISFRHANLHQGNLWEFPGGKIESGESVPLALQRELLEELGLKVLQSFPLKIINYQYSDKSVRLHVWRVTRWSGEARGLEGQAIAWKSIAQLNPAEFPAANAPIVKALQLPAVIGVTPVVSALEEFDAVLQHLLNQGLTCIQIRQPQLAAHAYLKWFLAANKLCAGKNTALMFNGDLGDFTKSGATGYHANSTRLMALGSRPVTDQHLFSASCHNVDELRKAAMLDADFVTLSPVKPVDKYALGAELGWEKFTDLLREAYVPVYAMGGLARQDLTTARQCGAHGICGIGMFLKKW